MHSYFAKAEHGPEISPAAVSLSANLTEDPDISPRLPRSAVDAHEILGSVVRECHGKIGSKGLRVSLRLLSRQYYINDDGERLRKVYLNLLNNAVAAARPGSSITLRSTCPSDCALRIEVEERSLPSAKPRIAEPLPTAKKRNLPVRGRR